MPRPVPCLCCQQIATTKTLLCFYEGMTVGGKAIFVKWPHSPRRKERKTSYLFDTCLPMSLKILMSSSVILSFYVLGTCRLIANFSAEGDRGMSKPSVLNRSESSTEVS